MSAPGQTQKSGRPLGRSVLPPETDIVGQVAEVRSVPGADKTKDDVGELQAIAFRERGVHCATTKDPYLGLLQFYELRWIWKCRNTHHLLKR